MDTNNLRSCMKFKGLPIKYVGTIYIYIFCCICINSGCKNLPKILKFFEEWDFKISNCFFGHFVTSEFSWTQEFNLILLLCSRKRLVMNQSRFGSSTRAPLLIIMRKWTYFRCSCTTSRKLRRKLRVRHQLSLLMLLSWNFSLTIDKLFRKQKLKD